MEPTPRSAGFVELHLHRTEDGIELACPDHGELGTWPTEASVAEAMLEHAKVHDAERAEAVARIEADLTSITDQAIEAWLRGEAETVPEPAPSLIGIPSLPFGHVALLEAVERADAHPSCEELLGTFDHVVTIACVDSFGRSSDHRLDPAEVNVACTLRELRKDERLVDVVIKEIEA